MIVYMAVTLDEYELPVAIADTTVELAEITGTTANSIRSAMCHAKKGTNGRKRSGFVKVEIDDEEEKEKERH